MKTGRRRLEDRGKTLTATRPWKIGAEDERHGHRNVNTSMPRGRYGQGGQRNLSGYMALYDLGWLRMNPVMRLQGGRAVRAEIYR